MFIWNSICWNSTCAKSTLLRGGFTWSRGGFSQWPALSSFNPGISNVYTKWVLPSKQIHMTFTGSKQAFQRNLAVWNEFAYFQTGKFTWNCALPIRELQIRFGHFILFVWNWVLPHKELHIEFSSSIRVFDMFVWMGILKQGYSYEICYFQTGNFIGHLAVWNKRWQSN